MCPLAVLWHFRPRFAYILGHSGRARRQGGREPAAAKPPLTSYYIYTVSTMSVQLVTSIYSTVTAVLTLYPSRNENTVQRILRHMVLLHINTWYIVHMI